MLVTKEDLRRKWTSIRSQISQTCQFHLDEIQRIHQSQFFEFCKRYGVHLSQIDNDGDENHEDSYDGEEGQVCLVIIFISKLLIYIILDDRKCGYVVFWMVILDV